MLTAHPTEAKRRAVVEHLWRIGALLEQLEDRSLGASEEQEIRRRMREEIAGLWRTDPIRPHRPEPLDEVRAVLALFDQTIFTTLPAVYREMDRTDRRRRLRCRDRRRSHRSSVGTRGSEAIGTGTRG